jgi:hypothetical protein
MIRTDRLCRRSVFCRVPRHARDPLLPTQPTARLLAQMTPPTILKVLIPIVTLRSGSSGDAGRAPIISLDTDRPG